MSHKKSKMLFTLLASALWLAMIASMAWSTEVPRMTKEELRPLLGDPSVIILDVRVGRSWTDSDRKIRGAIREDPSAEIASWAAKYPQDKTLVLYCT